VVALSVGLPAAGLLFQLVATVLDARRFPPPGRLVDVGGHRLHLQCQGAAGVPVVVLEAGNLSFSLQWAWIAPGIARTTRVCAYDRAGYGWSDPTPWPPIAGRQADDLARLLEIAGEPGPYVLVGHSYGALVSRAFAVRYPRAVAGVVLIDPAHPSQYDLQRCDPACLPAAFLRDLRRIYHLAPVLARFGIPRILRSDTLGLHSLVKPFPVELRPAITAALSSTRHWVTGSAEIEHFEESARDARALASLDGKPLVVVAADSTWAKQSDGYELPEGVDGKALDRTILALNRDQARLSTASQLVVVPGATHTSLATSERDAVAVVEAIRGVVARVRAAAPTGR
jgi:pimeloyl-ACP methyl ester carboxylesterase